MLPDSGLHRHMHIFSRLNKGLGYEATLTEFLDVAKVHNHNDCPI